MPILNGARLTDEQGRRIWEWMKANGCRDQIDRYSTIVVHGSLVTYEACCRVGKENRDVKRPAPNLGLCIRDGYIIPTKRTMRVRTRMPRLS